MGGGAGGARQGIGVLKNDVKQLYARISVSTPCGCHHLSGPRRVRKGQADSGVLSPASPSVFDRQGSRLNRWFTLKMSSVVRTRTRSRLLLSQRLHASCLNGFPAPAAQ